MTPAASPKGAALSPAAQRKQMFPARRDQVQVARAFISAILATCPAAGDAVLCVSELATNAVLHSASRNPGGTFTVRAALFDDHVWIEVEDNGGRWEDRPHRDGRSHGLDIVRELAADCGKDGGPLTGWVVWARLQWGTTMTDPSAARTRAQQSLRWVTVLDGTRLRQLRRQHGLSRQQLAVKAGISQSTVARLEPCSWITCRSRTLARLAAALEVHPATLTPDGPPVSRPAWC